MSHPFSPFAQASKEAEEAARAAPAGRRLRSEPKREDEATPKDGKGSIDVMYEQRLEQTYYKI